MGSDMWTRWTQQIISQINKLTLFSRCADFLYYVIAIDNTILPALSDISSEQSKATKNFAKQVANILNYLASNPQAEILYIAS